MYVEIRWTSVTDLDCALGNPVGCTARRKIENEMNKKCDPTQYVLIA